MNLRSALPAVLLLSLVSCGPDYSPDTYATNAVQQANKVEQGVVVGVRDVAVSAAGTMGAVTGGAAGGIAGSQVGVGPVSAFAALGGTLVGGITGAAVEHASGDTKAFEYIVRKASNDLVSVTQKDKAPLTLGQRVLVIAGNQARVVPDYTVTLTPAERARAEASAADGAPGASLQGQVSPSAVAAPAPAATVTSSSSATLSAPAAPAPSGGPPTILTGDPAASGSSPDPAGRAFHAAEAGAPSGGGIGSRDSAIVAAGAPIQLAQPTSGTQPAAETTR